MMPNDRRYCETHEWVKKEGDHVVVGISGYAQETLGDITFVELPAIGTIVKKGSECCVVESVKAASDLYSPVTGTITEVNKALETTPEMINSSPYSEGWVFKVKGFSEAEYESCMDAASYNTFLDKVR